MQNNKQEVLDSSRKIIVKIGSNVLTTKEGKMDRAAIADISGQVIELVKLGKQVVLVSSGAEVSGVSAVERWERHGDMNYKQAMCAIGQVELMIAYKENFSKSGLHVGQLLVTANDFENDSSTLHIRNTLFTLLDEGVVPIINENDSVSTEEISLGDNDNLAALTSNLWNADLLVLMSDIDGLYDKSPKQHKDAILLPEVDLNSSDLDSVDASGKGVLGTGGMESKINAAKKVGHYGTPLLLVNGKCKGILTDILAGEDNGTLFTGGK
ncbi:MAG: glutamate 5-kinase [Clostridiales Family XIII bacterium]|nr:glutamate 5-kinase [Clostridiales Family XIII bacterium]